MQPTLPNPAPNAPAPSSGDTLVEFVRTQRQNAGSALAILSVVFLLAGMFMAFRAFQKSPDSVQPEKPAVENPLDAENPQPPKLETVTTAKQGDYRAGMIGAFTAFLIVASGGGWLLVTPLRDTEALQRTEARTVILVIGGTLGLLLIANGGLFFYRWSESIVNWLEKGKEEEIRYVLLPIMMIALGAALGMASVAPARAEERNNPSLRRFVYSTNLGVTALLLFVVLIIANVVFAYRVENKIDMTDSGFYSMSPQTEEYLNNMDQPIEAYAILPGSIQREVRDLRDVLTRFQETSRDKFRVRFISPVTNTAELAALKVEYRDIEQGELGILLTIPDNKKRFTFIPVQEFFATEPGPRGEPSKSTFVGEARLVKELLFLADNKQRPKVYFTQSAEELQLTGQGSPRRLATQLRTFLETKNYLDVQPLTFETDTPKIPDDCAVLVVADPQKTMPAGQVEAIRKYMTERKGKLVVLSGATLPSPTQKKVIPTGLEPLLVQFNVGLSDKYLFARSADIRIPVFNPPVEFTRAAVEAKNPIVRLFRRISIDMPFPREVNALTTTPGMNATPLLTTDTEGGAWLTDEFPDNPDVRPANSPVARRRTVAVVVSEGNTGRVAVYGNGLIASDVVAEGFGRESPPAFDLIGATIDWLRDRPPIPAGVASKTYAVYTLPGAKTIDNTRLKYLPLGFGLLAIIGLGLGTWVIRRQQT